MDFTDQYLTEATRVAERIDRAAIERTVDLLCEVGALDLACLTAALPAFRFTPLQEGLQRTYEAAASV